MTEKKNIVMLVIILLSIHLLYSDSKYTEKNLSLTSVYFDFGGSSPLLSLNYDKQIYNKKISIRLGLGIVATRFSASYTFPIGVNYLFGRKHIFETGLGLTPWLSVDDNLRDFGKDNNKLHPNIWIGYRYQKPKSYFFKLGIAIYPENIPYLFILPGVSIGTSF
ncbi:MAG: hypothetical protein U9R41_08945 [Candidatus Marinimicrobia bacterium]|nr:hypothetical protein [Candidatus Neomarinimicrobiota bacterium]